MEIWVPPQILQDVFVQTSPNLPQILRHDILQTYREKFSLTEKCQSFEELILSWNELVAIAAFMIETRFRSIGLKSFLSRSMIFETSSVGLILCFKIEGAEERFKNDSLCICYLLTKNKQICSTLLVGCIVYLPPANFQQFNMNGYDPVTVLVMTYSIDGFQPEGTLKYSFNLNCNYTLIKIILKLSSFPYSSSIFKCRVHKLYEFLIEAIPAYCLQNNPP